MYIRSGQRTSYMPTLPNHLWTEIAIHGVTERKTLTFMHHLHQILAMKTFCPGEFPEFKRQKTKMWTELSKTTFFRVLLILSHSLFHVHLWYLSPPVLYPVKSVPSSFVFWFDLILLNEVFYLVSILSLFSSFECWQHALLFLSLVFQFSVMIVFALISDFHRWVFLKCSSSQ